MRPLHFFGCMTPLRVRKQSNCSFTVVSVCHLIRKHISELSCLGGCLSARTREECVFHALHCVWSQQRDESIRVLTVSMSSGAWQTPIKWNLNEWRRVFDGAVVLRRGAHEVSETLPEPRGDQAVDDRIDCRAEVKEDARHDVDVLINVVHQVSPLADGTPQESLDVKGRPADSKHCNHDCWRFRERQLVLDD